MDACDVVRLFVNKVIFPTEPKRRKNPGYVQVKALRVIVHARLKRLENNTRVFEHLKKYTDTFRTLGLSKVPERTMVGRWWRRYFDIL